MIPDARWQDVVASVDSDSSAVRVHADGSWSVSNLLGLGSVQALVARAPGTWREVVTVEEEMIDDSGEGVDIEWTAGLHVADDERAVLSWCDHWQAGLTVTLAVYPSNRAFAEALGEAKAELCESTSDVEDEPG